MLCIICYALMDYEYKLYKFSLVSCGLQKNLIFVLIYNIKFNILYNH